MSYKFRIALGLVLILALAVAVPVSAGGWAVITLDDLPTGVVAGEPLTVGFTVLQHGKTPMNDLDPILNVHLDKTDAFVVHALREGKPGHYTATLTFPKEGEWGWSIQAFTMDQTMPILSVAAPAVGTVSQPEAKTAPETSSIPLLLVIRALALAMGLISLAVAFRRRSRLAAGLTVLCLLIGIATFMPGADKTLALSPVESPETETQNLSSYKPYFNDAFISQVELGQQLFVAKGCITCHVNTKVRNNRDYWTIEMGATNLSKFTASPEALRLRLKDPSSVKSDTQMPNLNLSEAEIEALIAFINSN